jgi:predicted RNA-binding Zn-ribbon protein involved in translation (DUF1610 family)
MRRADLRRLARANTGERIQSDVLCMACGWQGWIEYRIPRERWRCPACGKRDIVRDEDEAGRPERGTMQEGEA